MSAHDAAYSGQSTGTGHSSSSHVDVTIYRHPDGSLQIYPGGEKQAPAVAKFCGPASELEGLIETLACLCCTDEENAVRAAKANAKATKAA